MRYCFAFTLALVMAAPAFCQGGMGPGMAGRRGMDADAAHDTIHSLLQDHDRIERRVKDLPDGVETWTESDDPEVAGRIRSHVRQMKERLESGQPMRRWDPLFAAIFEHADRIEMTIVDVPRGVHVVETSDDPEVVALIRQHAHRAVSEFVAQGMDRAHEPTPLPEAPATAVPAGDGPAREELQAGAGYRLIGFTFQAGQGLPAHTTPLDAFFRVTEGTVRVTIGETVHMLGAGEGVLLPKDVLHEVHAVTAARAVLIR